MDVERDITVLVKAFERPEALRRLLASVRALYERALYEARADRRRRRLPLWRRHGTDLQQSGVRPPT